jgi:FixJ family two-component response regulator
MNGRHVPQPAPEDQHVLFVEDNDDLRDVLMELTEFTLYRPCVGARSYDELVALGESALQCSVAIVDINLGPNRPSGLDAYRWLREHGHRGRIVFLTGHAGNHPLVVEAQRIGDAEVIGKPIEPERLRSIIEGTRR